MPISMNKAKAVKVDEFYTMLSDVEAELQHYRHFFKGKAVYCCCDNPQYSSFCKYFSGHYNELGISSLICTWLQNGGKICFKAKYDRINRNFKYYKIEGNGSYDTSDCLKIMGQSDIVVTNPPFSKSQVFLELLISLNKKFIIVCNRNTITTKKIFPLFMEGKLKFGFGFKGDTANFVIPPMLYGHYSKDVVRGDKNIVRFRNVCWVTNFEINVPAKELLLTKKYSKRKYPKYDQYDAINIDKLTDIPFDYYGVMGVPITILDRFDYDTFELLGLDRLMPMNSSKKRFTIKGKEKYARILIRRKTN